MFYLTLMCIKCLPRDPKWTADPFHFHTTYDLIILPEMVWIYQKLWVLFHFSGGPGGPINETKFTIEFSPFYTKVKLWYHVSYHENWKIHEIWAFCHFSTKTVHQIYCAWINEEPAPTCFCSVMSHYKKKICKTWQSVRLSCFPC